ERFDQLRQLMIRVESARLRQQPQARIADALLLRPDRRARSREADAIRADANDRHPARSIAAHLALEPLVSVDELVARQLRGSRRRARDEIGDAAAVVEQQPVLPRLQQTR